MGGIGVVLAIGVGLVSSFIQSLGLTIQRKSHIQNDALPIQAQRRPLRRPLWCFGFGIYIVTNILGTIFQLDALPIVILAPLGAVSLIYNALLARLILGDRFGARMVGGTALVWAGAVLIAVYGVVDEVEHSIDELLVLWGRPAFLAFFWVVIGLTLIVLIASHVISFFTYRAMRSIRLPADEEDEASLTPTDSLPPSNYASPHSVTPIPFRPTTRRWSAPLSATRQDGLPTLSSLSIQDSSNPSSSPAKQVHTVRFAPIPPRTPSPTSSPLPTYIEPTAAQQKTIMSLGLSFAAASGVLSGMSLVLAKAAVELLVITLEYYRTGKGSNQFQHFQSWLLVAGLLSGGLAQLVYLNYSLTFASPALICPLAFCFFNLSSIFDGLVFYDQFSRLHTHQIILVSIGVALLLIGVCVVSIVEPTGQGGVEIGTWVEEEDDDDTAPLLNLPVNPTGSMSQLIQEQNDQSQEPTPTAYDQPFSDRLTSPTRTSPLRPGVQRNDTFPFHPPTSPDSPTPLSPTSPRRRRMRYGTLIPELAPVGAPTGFAIGLGASSPGFVLRPGPHAYGIPGAGAHEGRMRSRSEGARGIQDIIAQGAASDTGTGADNATRTGLGIRGSDLDLEQQGALSGSAQITSGGGQVHMSTEPIEDRSRGGAVSWWSRLFRRDEGKIRLEGQDGSQR